MCKRDAIRDMGCAWKTARCRPLSRFPAKTYSRARSENTQLLQKMATTYIMHIDIWAKHLLYTLQPVFFFFSELALNKICLALRIF